MGVGRGTLGAGESPVGVERRASSPFLPTVHRNSVHSQVTAEDGPEGPGAEMSGTFVAPDMYWQLGDGTVLRDTQIIGGGVQANIQDMYPTCTAGPPPGPPGRVCRFIQCAGPGRAPPCGEKDVEPYSLAGHYETGDVVAVVAEIYACREFPFGLWCNNNAYRPGGNLWKDAWVKHGDCVGTHSPTVLVSRANTERTSSSWRGNCSSSPAVHFHPTTLAPTITPRPTTAAPTDPPTRKPTHPPTPKPVSAAPSPIPSDPPTTAAPSPIPSASPTVSSSLRPSVSGAPSGYPSRISAVPTTFPSWAISGAPSGQPSLWHSRGPSSRPSDPPSTAASAAPSRQPSASVPQTQGPSTAASAAPSRQPSASVPQTQGPSAAASAAPSRQPSIFVPAPSVVPSSSQGPSNTASAVPSRQPSIFVPQTQGPSNTASAVPSRQPSIPQTQGPSTAASAVPSRQPSIVQQLLPQTQGPSTAPSAACQCIPTFVGTDIFDYTLIALGDATTNPHSVYTNVWVEGQLKNPTPSSNVAIGGMVYFGSINWHTGNSGFSFNGGKTKLSTIPTSTWPIDFAQLEWLANNIKAGSYANNRQVFVVHTPKNSCWKMTDFLGQE